MLYFYYSGRLNEYLIPSYRPLVAVSGFVMLGIAASLAYTLSQGARWRMAGGLIADDAADELASPGRVRTMQFLAFGLLVLPIWSATGVSKDGFSASAVRNRGIVADASRLPGGPPPRWWPRRLRRRRRLLPSKSRRCPARRRSRRMLPAARVPTRRWMRHNT